MAAALRYLGNTLEDDYLRRLLELPAPRKWLLCCPRGGDETILAAASGAEPWVLEQALRSVTAEFAQSTQIELLPCHEPRRLIWLLRLQRRRLLPVWAQRVLGRRLWRESSVSTREENKA